MMLASLFHIRGCNDISYLCAVPFVCHVIKNVLHSFHHAINWDLMYFWLLVALYDIKPKFVSLYVNDLTLYDNPWTLLLSSPCTEINRIYGKIKFKKIPIPLLSAYAWISLGTLKHSKAWNLFTFWTFFITIFYFPSEWTTTWRMRF